MPWYNPASWFARPSQKDPADREADGDGPQFSRHAIDSTDIPMDSMFSMRLPHDARHLGGRLARAKGFSSLAEYMRYLLNAEINKAIADDESVCGDEMAKALHMGRGR